MINLNRLEFALKRRGLSQTALSEQLGITTRTLHNYIKDPSKLNIDVLSKILDFPVTFFYQKDDLPDIPDHTVSFRSMSKTSTKLKNIAISYGVTGFLLNDWFEEEFDLPQADLPDLSHMEPEEASIFLRREWGLGEAPIGNMIALLESKGIRVFSLAMEAEEVDAFSVWQNNQPFIFLNTKKSAERSRFDAAHELGHLVRDTYSMKHSNSTCSKTPTSINDQRSIERQADAFASAFLMPRSNMFAHKKNFVNINTLISQKKIWGVSVVALAYRMHKLGIISDWVYTRILCPEIAKNKYRSIEPFPMKHEKSVVLEKILDALNEDNIGIKEIAEKILVSETDIGHLTFGLTARTLFLLKKKQDIEFNEKESSPDSSHLKLL